MPVLPENLAQGIFMCLNKEVLHGAVYTGFESVCFCLGADAAVHLPTWFECQ